MLFAFRPGTALAVAALVLAGAGAAYIIGLDQWFVDAVPEHLRGRAMTLLTAGLMTFQGIGMALAGLAAEFVPRAPGGRRCSGVIGTRLPRCLLILEVRRTRVRGPKYETVLTAM